MDIFKELIASLTPFFKKMGFDKKGNSFYLETDKNYGIVNFQKSRESTKDLVQFTINFGVYSDVLGRFQYNYRVSATPEVEECHWHSRVGHFMPGTPDYWWNLSVADDLYHITSDVIKIVQDVLMPEISQRLSDEGLLRSWMSEAFAGTTEIGRFKYLTILLKAKGCNEALHQVVEAFMQKSKGRPNASIAMEHLKEIEYSS
jgi:hypothetical protein